MKRKANSKRQSCRASGQLGLHPHHEEIEETRRRLEEELNLKLRWQELLSEADRVEDQGKLREAMELITEAASLVPGDIETDGRRQALVAKLMARNLESFRLSELPSQLAREWFSSGRGVAANRVERTLEESGLLPIDLSEALSIVEESYRSELAQATALRDRVLLRVQQARAAIARGEFAAAEQTINEVRDLNPKASELPKLESELELERQVRADIMSMRKMLEGHRYADAVVKFKSSPALSDRDEAVRISQVAHRRYGMSQDLDRDLASVNRLRQDNRHAEALCVLQFLSRDGKYSEVASRIQKHLAPLQTRLRLENGVLARELPADMVLISGGRFTMGSGSRPELKRGECSVFLRRYAIDRYPVTNSEYGAFLDEIESDSSDEFAHPDQPVGKSHLPADWSSVGADDQLKPVTGIDWFDAHAYATWKGRRLPSEAEWEKAGYWDEANEREWRYPWGSKFSTTMCNTGRPDADGPTPVNQFRNGKSSYGLHDMCGNVWEFCADWYRPSQIATALREAAFNPGISLTISDRMEKSWAYEPTGPPYGDGRVIRGGSWADDGADVGAACRSVAYLLTRSNVLGFRCALTLPPLENED